MDDGQIYIPRWRTLFNGALPLGVTGKVVAIPSPRRWVKAFVAARGVSFVGAGPILLRFATDGATFDAVAANHVQSTASVAGARTGAGMCGGADPAAGDVLDSIMTITLAAGDFPHWFGQHRNQTVALTQHHSGWWSNSGGLPVNALQLIGPAGAGNIAGGTLLVKVFG